MIQQSVFHGSIRRFALFPSLRDNIPLTTSRKRVYRRRTSTLQSLTNCFIVLLSFSISNSEGLYRLRGVESIVAPPWSWLELEPG